MRKIASLKTSRWLLTFIPVAFVLGLTVGSHVTKFNIDKDLAGLNEEAHLGQRRLINPLLECPDHPHGPTPKEIALQGLVDNQIAEFKKHAPKSMVSVYYRDLNNGPTVTVNPQEPYIGASLMKTPVAIWYYLKAESDRGLLDREIRFDPGKDVSQDIQQTINPPPALVPGKGYRISELIERMLEFSDNDSSAMLLNYDPQLSIERVLKDMGVPTVVHDSEAWVTVRDYASIFRILYNSTYLSRGASNHILELLAKADFKGGLRDGLPPDVLISQKFGERTLGDSRQMHDCGIVYFPQRPYLLCVMTKGPYDLRTLDTVVQSISRTVFEYVKSGN